MDRVFGRMVARRHFILRELLADLGAVYLIILGTLPILTMLFARKGLWGFSRPRLPARPSSQDRGCQMSAFGCERD